MKQKYKSIMNRVMVMATDWVPSGDVRTMSTQHGWKPFGSTAATMQKDGDTHLLMVRMENEDTDEVVE